MRCTVFPSESSLLHFTWLVVIRQTQRSTDMAMGWVGLCLVARN